MDISNLTQEPEDYGIRGRYTVTEPSPEMSISGWSKRDGEWMVRVFAPKGTTPWQRDLEGTEQDVPKRDGSTSHVTLGQIADAVKAEGGMDLFYRVAARKPEREPIEAEGMYARIDPEDLDLDIFRVRKSQAGRFYALRLDFASEEFIYEPSAIRGIDPEDRLTLEQAKSLGHMFGRCIVCWAALTDPKSVERGIGPVCAKRV